MAVYFVGSYNIVDEDRYQSYLSGVVPLLQKHGAEVLVADHEPTNLEGHGSGFNVVLKI